MGGLNWEDTGKKGRVTGSCQSDVEKEGLVDKETTSHEPHGNIQMNKYGLI